MKVNPKIATIISTLGLLLLVEGGLMLTSIFVSLFFEGEDIFVLAISSVSTMLVGFFCWFFFHKHKTVLDKRTGYMIVSLIWIVMSLFGCLPYVLGGYLESFGDAFFETMSGFTTTGATLFVDVESLPHGLLYWRSMTHWIGGIGIIVILLAVVPFFGKGGVSLFAAEVPGPSKDKFSPRMKSTAKSLINIYILLTLVCFLTYWVSGISLYESLCTAFSTLSSGGFLIRNSGASEFTPLQQYIMIFFMFVAGINFTLIFYLFRRSANRFKTNDEFRVYVTLVLICSIVIAVGLYFSMPSLGVESSFRAALFQVVSIVSTTGFVSCDYMNWIPPLWFLLFILLFSGAMSGSTSGGIKLVRHIVLFKNVRQILRTSIHANAYIPMKLNGKIVGDGIVFNVLAIFLLYILTMAVSTVLLVFFGEGVEDALGAVATCIGGVGPGIGTSGGFGNCASFLPESKWVLSVGMYLGRLEIASVLVLFSPMYWKT